ncbi:MAG: response regulator, partial [Actinobacteria bacterium]|nr:response regulator [Actinomycetota bacterium]
GMALVIVWDVAHPMHYGVIGYAVRGISFFMLGGLLGRFVSARRRLERQIARFEELSVDLVATASFDGYFKRLNPAWEHTLGYSKQELRSRPFVDFVHPDDRESTVAEAAKLAELGTDSVSFRNRYRASDGSYRWLDWNARAVAEDDLIYATARDVTERKQDDDAIRAARAEADQANRAKSEFLSRMSHELRTPLNAILGFGQLLEIEDLDARERESVEQIMRAGRHLLELINEVLDISRIDAGTMSVSLEAVDVVSAVSDAVSLVSPLARERNIDLVADVALPAAPYVKADRQRLRQVLLNLLSNAVKYNRESGSVEISLHRTGERLRLAVKDTGIGVSDARLAQLFEPFERLGAERGGVEGTGLGLALSKRLVDAMGGSITAQSQAGKGTTFLVDLAVAPSPVSEQALAAAALAGESKRADIGACSLLYVEDNLSNLKLIEHIFAGRPEVKLLSAMQGELGLELARSQRPDVILLDLHLPDMPGERVLERLREDPDTHEIPVIVLSADATAGQVKRLVESGASGYLTKPLTSEPHTAERWDVAARWDGYEPRSG